MVLEKVTGRDSGGDRYYKIEYEYDWNNKHHTETSGVGKQKYEKLEEGDSVMVRFLPAMREWTQQLGNPDKTYDYPDWTMVLFYIFVTIFWNTIAGLFFMILYVAPFLNWWLLRFGSTSLGVIEEKYSERDSDGDKKFKFSYVFEPGKKLTASQELTTDRFYSRSSRALTGEATTSQFTAHKFSKGDPVCVLYSTLWPRINMALELSGYELCTDSKRFH